MITFLKHLSVLSCLILLSACTTLMPSSQPAPTNAAHQQQLQKLDPWSLQGRVAINDGHSGSNANFTWQQQQQNFDIALSGPLGMGHVTVSGTPSTATLKTGQGLQHAATPELLLQQQLGWNLPVTPLIYWIRGMPTPHFPAKYTLDQRHRLAQLSQAGWQINYLNYMAVNGIELPAKIQLVHTSLQVRIIIYDWHITHA